MSVVIGLGRVNRNRFEFRIIAVATGSPVKFAFLVRSGSSPRRLFLIEVRIIEQDGMVRDYGYILYNMSMHGGLQVVVRTRCSVYLSCETRNVERSWERRKKYF